MGTAELFLGFVVAFHLVKGDNATYFSALGRPATLPCPYHYEDLSPLPELSVQWRSPQNQLLCHYVKHKAFLNCSEGYSLSYSPARISLMVEWVQERDYGTHLCSVNKRHEFTDSHVKLQRPEEDPEQEHQEEDEQELSVKAEATNQHSAESVTLLPGNGVTFSGHCWTLLPFFLMLVHYNLNR